jgi:hypothetical protein
MKKINRNDRIIRSSCNGKGCYVRFTLPYDSTPNNVYMEVYGKRNDIPKILPTSNLLLDKVA